MLHSDWFSLIMLVSANMSITNMMQGYNRNIKVLLGIAPFANYLEMYMVYYCVVVFCLYNIMALYNIPFGFKIFALLTCISKTYWVNILSFSVTMVHVYILTFFSRELFSLSHWYINFNWGYWADKIKVL